jgi:hypothetical protein
LAEAEKQYLSQLVSTFTHERFLNQPFEYEGRGLREPSVKVHFTRVLIDQDIVAPVESTKVEWQWRRSSHGDAYCLWQLKFFRKAFEWQIRIADTVKQDQGIRWGLCGRS